jgi:hypothetical protein
MLAQKTKRPITLVRDLYDEELANLAANYRVTKFIDAITRRRVKQRLLAQGQGRYPDLEPLLIDRQRAEILRLLDVPRD